MADKTRLYTVECSIFSEFPLDMLRHDDAAPATEDAQKMIDRLNARDIDGIDGKTVKIALVSRWRGAPNVKRWESFGCKVVECDDPIVMLSDSDPDAERVKLLRSLLRQLQRSGPKTNAGVFGMAILNVVREAIDCTSRHGEDRDRILGQVIGVRSTLLCVTHLYEVEEFVELLDVVSNVLTTRTLREVNSVKERADGVLNRLKALEQKAA